MDGIHFLKMLDLFLLKNIALNISLNTLMKDIGVDNAKI